jgi:hypothetical protein
MTDLWEAIITGLLKVIVAAISVIVTAVVVPWLNTTVIPYLKEKRLYNIVCRFVQAAEKMSDGGTLDKTAKRDYVVKLLMSKGIAVDDEISALIESAVEELDLAVSESASQITEVFVPEETASEEVVAEE